ncbi:pyrroline-5-carboxylate reductase [Thioalkalivibrio versutus]|uniref:Pyrroline-5-carboxylate reductase n=1 Tax=Thioalkalivibrio versutus TaxID=106634 RepID=A0A0G3GBI5_9GAMM|nr:pyrroline-5-carboxylate reductase [Thioalkalivibrio versutus]AKJ96166.1 pyrroline-5-carboxylate reductase [Thioalkalivibrio versutus]
MTEHRFEVGFIGAGNMGEALLQGLVQSGHAAERIAIADKSAERIRDLQARYPGLGSGSAAELAASSAALVLAVKPQTLPELAPTLRDAVNQGQPLVISVAAGITTTQLAGWLGDATRLVRAMPNTPALVGAGVTGLYAASTAGPEDRAIATRLLEAVGRAIWVEDEEQMHAVTATSGSGPAYVFLMIEAMQEAAQSLGLPADTALELTLGTLAGATRLAAETDETAAELRHRVTSPGGTTERALQVLEDSDLRDLMRRAMTAAADRSRELGR